MHLNIANSCGVSADSFKETIEFHSLCIIRISENGPDAELTFP